MMPLPTDDEVFAEVCRARNACGQPRYVSEPAAKEVMAAVRTLIAPAALAAQSQGAQAALREAADYCDQQRAGTSNYAGQCADVIRQKLMPKYAALAAQSQGAQAVAWAVVVGENMANTVHLTVDAEEAQCEYEASVAGGFESVYNLVPLYRSAQQAAAPGALHASIMNIPTDPSHDAFTAWVPGEREAYLLGHRDARHAAAELALTAAAPSAPGTPEAPKGGA